ncbi:bifunctional oligoribonuclease/PAP phosphatase NrnA [Mycoplasma sp. U97]|uniref:DHH family phosphoesterase n=1 Tax=Mycoplasma tauri TaxID=547987 RepID=UPI001CBB984F|nr:bifunctional oligoribonuclease/PAP phosphatase NrnA [Mycoplasma tauri]MBZ4212428.1 bifunctional oligoribonuclease/PAP phosphatase NrnA [Mycoplasma tauri]
MKIGNAKVAIEAIEKYKNIIIFHHIRPDGDCLGCQAGLAELIRDNYPNKRVYKVGDNVGVFDFMEYDFDDISSIDFSNSLGIVCDASSSDRIECSQLLLDKKFTETLRIDHHPNGSDIEYDYLWVDEHYVAAAEMIADIAREADWKISKKAASHVFLGIVTDSGRFLYPDTSSRTFKLAAHLYDKSNFSPDFIYKNLNQRSVQDIKFIGQILSNFKKDGRVLYYCITPDVMKEIGFDSLKAASFVNELANIEDNSCWAFFIELEDGKVRGRLRSNGPLVNKVANKYNGGGHDNAAGITIDNWDMVPAVLKDLNNAITEWEAK